MSDDLISTALEYRLQDPNEIKDNPKRLYVKQGMVLVCIEAGIIEGKPQTDEWGREFLY